MGIGQHSGKKKSLAIVALVGALLASAATLIVRTRPPPAINTALAYYTDDDGQTWFLDSSTLIPPFGHHGKMAVSAHIYTYANGSKQFCAFESKYTDDGKRRLEASIAAALARGGKWGDADLLADTSFQAAAGLVKLPGANKAWVPLNNSHSGEICTVRAPDGSDVDVAAIY